MTCRIDRVFIEQGVVLRISGRMTGKDLDVLRTALEEGRVVEIDLTEVELADRDAVTLLARTETDGIALEGHSVVAIELAEIELVDRDAVKLLALAEANGIELRHCPAYIREWMTRERRRS